jgi:hypothetical protein
VAAAIADALAKVGSSDISDADLAAVTAKLDSVKDRLQTAKANLTSAIQGIFEPTTAPPTEPPPAPEIPGDVTPPV